MPYRGLLLHDRFVVLAVCAPCRAQILPPAHVEEELGEVEILPLARGAVELREGELHLLMARGLLYLRRPVAKRAAHQISRAAGDIEEVGLAGRLETRHRRLYHVPQVV